ncbi:hypothetical protein RhiirA4_471179 [Rhizophagus irregularis]|uniref:Uncharacterized protein n=1 Tax=Rhizophagus irregularis TaxID=588596 RepID=A0A2I1H2R4_9GLOM|nr:hypothetical protein RhiirA4_471179 [Rhizophagus irregularis]
MPENLVWCTCQICSLEKEGGSWKSKGSKVMLAYIQWTSPVNEDDVGVKTFRRTGAYEFVDASAIDHCVGFIEIDKLFYIIDKEVDSDE